MTNMDSYFASGLGSENDPLVTLGLYAIVYILPAAVCLFLIYLILYLLKAKYASGSHISWLIGFVFIPSASISVAFISISLAYLIVFLDSIVVCILLLIRIYVLARERPPLDRTSYTPHIIKPGASTSSVPEDSQSAAPQTTADSSKDSPGK